LLKLEIYCNDHSLISLKPFLCENPKRLILQPSPTKSLLCATNASECTSTHTHDFPGPFLCEIPKKTHRATISNKITFVCDKCPRMHVTAHKDFPGPAP